MVKQPERFDMSRPPVRTKWYLKPLTYLISKPVLMSHRQRLTKNGMDGVKPPYLMLCNHNAFMDIMAAAAAVYPNRANYVVAIDGFIGREKLLRDVGCICKRKFTSDLSLIRNLRRVISNGDIAVVYPEARYSLCGTTAVLPQSMAKLARMLRVPVVTFICHGHHINSPFWNLHQRKVKPIEAEMSLLMTPDEMSSMTDDEINDRIVKAFSYDEYEWQLEKGIRVTYKGRAEGLEKVLYQCPACGTEYRMKTSGAELVCGACRKRWTLSELGQLESDGDPIFSHIPDWYEWERGNVRREVEAGTYTTGDMPVTVRSLPNAKRFILLGEGTMTHDMTGFHVSGRDGDGDPFTMEKPVPSLYSCHIEYEYLGEFGDCVDLNTLDDTWYIYPHDCDFSVTKMALATEELYCKYRRDIGNPCRPGLA